MAWLQGFNGSSWHALKEFVLCERKTDAGTQCTRPRGVPTVMGQELKLSAPELREAQRAMHRKGFDMFACEAAFTREGFK